jgi:hypothetical protein
MKLLDGEKVLIESSNLLLTTHRVRHLAGQGNLSNFTSIMLEEVSSIEGSRQAFPWLLALSVFALLVAAGLGYTSLKMNVNTAEEILAYRSREANAQALFWTGVVLLALYFFVRRKVLAIASGGATIRCSLELFSNRDSVQDFTDALEAAKDERLKMLQRPGEKT